VNAILKAAAYIFHPLLMPLYGMFCYYSVTPKFIDQRIMVSKYLAIAIVLVSIPLVSYLLLKNLRIVNSIQLETVQERKIPLLLQCFLTLLVIKTLFSPFGSPELYYFFIGALFSSFSALVLVYFKIKASLHLIGISGVLVFIVGLSAHFKINLLLWLSCFIFATGWVATSRLHTKSHTPSEIVIGFVLGALPQFIVFTYWL